MRPTRFLVRLALLPMLALLAGCSSEKNTFVAVQWHNLLAKYNGYFLANEKIKEVETGLVKGQIQKDNYNKPLPPLPPPGAATGQATVLDEAIKKASIPIQRHKNSDWVDDSYLLIGQARYYKDDYENALHTFKWVNAKGKDVNAKHSSLIWLLRTYTDMKEYRFADAAIDAIKKKRMTPRNRRDYALALANLYYRQREWPQVLANVETALPLMRRNETRGRMEYLTGQLFQMQGQEDKAREHYRMVLRCRPGYELGFNAKLQLAQVTNVQNPKEVKRIQRYFKKLLKDEKNLEFKDKIYHEMARFELKQSKIKEAIDYNNLSLRSNGKSQGLKGYTYLNLGKIYYERLKRFNIAKNYYDSAVAAIDTADEGYKDIVKRQRVLADFVKEYEVVVREDSLQRLAGMDSSARFAIIDKMIADKAKSDVLAAKATEKAERQANRGGGGDEPFANSAFPQTTTSTADAAGATGAGGSWYFYNPAQVARGRSQFQRKWGRRPLEDNWRRVKKDPSNSDDNSSTAGTTGQKPGTDSTKQVAAAGGNETATTGGKDGKKANDKDGAPIVVTQTEARANYLKDLPLTPTALDASNTKLRLALFNIGKIYDQKLEEPANAVVSFRRAGAQFGDWDKVPESLYSLYLLYSRTGANSRNQAGFAPQPEKADSVKQVLFSSYPNTLFAKLVNNPNYLVEARAATEAAKKVYADAYYNYKSSRYIEASNLIASIRREYPENTFNDRVDLLAAMIIGKTVDVNLYKDSLTSFMRRYPKTDLQPTAKQMMDRANKFGKSAPSDADSSAPKTTTSALPGSASAEIAWKENIEGTHLYIAVIPKNSLPESEASARISNFNTVLFAEDEYTTNNLMLNDDLYMITVREIRNKAVAQYYLSRQTNGLDGSFDDLEGVKITHLIITPENYSLLYRTKNLASYLKFFKKNYKEQ